MRKIPLPSKNRPFVRSGLAILLLGAVAAFGLAGCGAAVLPSIHSDAERMTLAKRLRDEHKYATAAALLRTYIDLNAGRADIDQAIYLLGECELGMKDWVGAGASFERVLRDYPESDSAGSASFRIGESLYGQARPPDFDQEFTSRAIEQWQSYLRGYPGHWRNAEAETRIVRARTQIATKLVATGQLYLKLKLYEPARVYFQRIATEFSDTPLVGEALIGLAICEAHQGKKDEAIERLKQLESQFSGQPLAARAARERARLER